MGDVYWKGRRPLGLRAVGLIRASGYIRVTGLYLPSNDIHNLIATQWAQADLSIKVDRLLTVQIVVIPEMTALG